MKNEFPIWSSDRNFNLEDAENQSYYYVVEHDDLIAKARHDLTARELKIMDFIISKIKPDDDEFFQVETSMYELSKVLNIKINGKNYSDLAQSIGSLRKKDVLIYNDSEETVTQTGWVEKAIYHRSGQVEIKLAQELAPYLLGLTKQGKDYTQYLLLDTVRLKSRFSILLYKLMREADEASGKKIAILSGTPEDFGKWFGATKSYWRADNTLNFGKFNDRILKPAIEDINLKIEDMSLVSYTAKRGKKTVQVEVHNEFVRGSE